MPLRVQGAFYCFLKRLKLVYDFELIAEGH